MNNESKDKESDNEKNKSAQEIEIKKILKPIGDCREGIKKTILELNY